MLTLGNGTNINIIITLSLPMITPNPAGKLVLWHNAFIANLRPFLCGIFWIQTVGVVRWSVGQMASELPFLIKILSMLQQNALHKARSIFKE